MTDRVVSFMIVGCLLLGNPLEVSGQDLTQASPPRPSSESNGLRLVSGAIETAAAADRYEAGPLREALLGDAYRDVWGMPVRAGVLDLDQTAGGLSVVGEGDDSSTLLLKGSDGRHFVLTRLEKDAGDSLPPGFHRTVVEDVAQDQVSSLNPFAPLVVAALAAAAGIRHLEPVLVIVPDSRRLGRHRNAFADRLALLEPRPAELVGLEEMLERIRSDASIHVDEHAYARARLFDMWIGDRERQEENWLWRAEGNRFEPVPVDREFAFARFDGLLNRIGRLIGKGRRQTYFGSDLDGLSGLNHRAARLDYRFTSGLGREDWMNIARDLQESLSDAVIEQSVRRLPEPVFADIGRETIEVLMSRRDQIPEAAGEYYEKMMQNVDIIGTDGPDVFTVRADANEHAVVDVTSGGREAYRRTIIADDTDEVRLFGLGGDDRFVVDGEPGFIVFIVGGDGDETVERSGGDERVRFYDTELEPGAPGVKVKRLGRSSENRYRFHHFQFDKGSPAVAVDYDSDEGIYLGLGIKMKRYGFMREPYASRHVVRGNYAPASNGYNVSYDGRIYQIVADWDANFEADILEEELFNDFYGFGNETSGSKANRQRYVARFRWITAYPAFYHSFGRYIQIGLGPYFEHADIEPPKGVSEEAPVSGFTRQDFVDTYFIGLRTRFEADGRDSELLTKSGFRFVAEAGVHTGVRHAKNRLARLAADASYFHTLAIPTRPTLALRAGGATNLGDFTFFQANMLGGHDNLRAYRKTRFSGRSSAYANSELRVKVTDFNVYLTRGELGLFGFYDIGRVWMDGERSGTWHPGYGAGVWATPFYRFVLSGSYGISDEGSLVDISFGMFF